MANQMNIAGATSGNSVNLPNVLLDVYAKEILFTAQPNLRFAQVAVRKTDLTQLPGQRIKFLKYGAITGSAALTETVAMETGVLSTATLQIAVGEYGKAVAMSEVLLRQSVTDVLKDAATLLGNHYAVVEDSLVRDALLGSPNVLYAKARANRAALIATDTLDVDLFRETLELLATKKAPKFNGQDYIAFLHPHQTKALRKDSAWQQAQYYTTPENILRGECGRIENIRVIETTNVTYIKKSTQQIWADNADTGVTTAIAANTVTDVYQAVAVGEYAVGIATALPVEMRDNGVTDFGRTHAIAWYSIFGVGLLETGHSAVLETA